MENEKGLSFIENSFLKELLKDKDITDISFNGEYIFFEHTFFGRQKSNILINQSEAKDFIRQIANVTEQQFSFQNPILDVSIGKYRLNAVHQSIGKVRDNDALTFSIRIASDEPRISDDSGFLSRELVCLFEAIIESHQSIVIGGITGSGKTEFQKYLLRKIPSNERIIIIDNVLELDQIRNEEGKDVNSWQIDDRNENSTIQALVRNALRSNPDWLIVAESRGKEMAEILNAAMTGHPVITTLHALDLKSIPNRLTRMVMMGDKKSDYRDVLNDINAHFPFYIYLNKKKEKDGSINRFIQSVGVMEDGKIVEIYNFNEEKYSKIPLKVLKTLNSEHKIFYQTFGDIGNE